MPMIGHVLTSYESICNFEKALRSEIIRKSVFNFFSIPKENLYFCVSIPDFTQEYGDLDLDLDNNSNQTLVCCYNQPT